MNPEKTQSDEIDFARTLLKLWSRRKWIAAGTVLVTLLGVINALLATPLYRSSGTIAMREAPEAGFSSFASQLGGGGGIASFLGMGNTGIDKVELILKSWGFADDVVAKNDLLPRLFPEDWDESRKAWKKPDEEPSVRAGAASLRFGMMDIFLDPKRQVLDIHAFTPDPYLSKDLVEYYLAELNHRIREDVITSSEANQRFLEAQLGSATDPVVREKIQQLIAGEIEKAMLVYSSAFDVVIKPLLPLRHSYPRRFGMVAKAFIFGAFLSLAASFAWDGYGWLRARIRAANARA